MPDKSDATCDATHRLLPARHVWERYGIADRTLDRWLKRHDLGFPQPAVVNGRRYWREMELIQWERSRIIKRTT